MDDKDLILAIDVGGTKTIVSLIDREANTIIKRKFVTPTRNSQTLIGEIIRQIESLVMSSGRTLSELLGIGIGIAGLVNFSKGLVIFAPNLPLENTPVRKPFSDHFGLPVFVDNDANVAALGEKYYGAAINVQNFICLTVGTGVGGGIVIDERLYRGATGSAGEIGHMVIDMDGPLCSCGNSGCLEAFVSGGAISKRAKEMVEEKKNGFLAAFPEDEITGELVADGAQQDDETCLEVFRITGTYLGVALVNIANIFNPQMIVIGGGAGEARELLLEPAREVISERSMDGVDESLLVVSAQLGADAGVIGASSLVMHEMGLLK